MTTDTVRENSNLLGNRNTQKKKKKTQLKKPNE